MKALIGAFNKVVAFSMIVKTNGSFAALLRMLIWVLRLKGLHFS